MSKQYIFRGVETRTATNGKKFFELPAGQYNVGDTLYFAAKEPVLQMRGRFAGKSTPALAEEFVCEITGVGEIYSDFEGHKTQRYYF